LKDQILLLLQLGDGDISRLTSSHPSMRIRSLLTHVHTFYPEVESFTKNGDKFDWVKYRQMTFNSPNLTKFSPTTILRYMVISIPVIFDYKDEWMGCVCVHIHVCVYNYIPVHGKSKKLPGDKLLVNNLIFRYPSSIPYKNKY